MLIGAINVADKINKGLRVINQQLNVICENQQCFLAVYKETHLLQWEGRKTSGKVPGYNN